jgi:hypothetical protein
MSLLHEYRQYIVRALGTLPEGDITDTGRQAQLHAALGNVLFHTAGPGRDGIAAFSSALQLADRTGDLANRLRAFSGLCATYLGTGNYRQGLACAESFNSALGHAAEPSARIISNRLLGLSLSFAGQQARALEIAQCLYNEPVREVHRTRNSGVQFDQRVAAGTLLARTLWLRGYQDQALQVAKETAGEAQCIEHALSMCYALATAVYPICCWSGDDESGDRYLAVITDQALMHSLVYWQTWARGFAILRRTRNAAFGPPAPAMKHDLVRDLASAVGPQLEIFATLSEQYAAMHALERAQSGDAGWATAEILRASAAMALAATAANNANDAEAMLLQSMDVARRQEALSFELRSAMTLAALWGSQGKLREARDLVSLTYGKFAEGHERADLQKARELMDALLRPGDKVSQQSCSWLKPLPQGNWRLIVADVTSFRGADRG